MDATTCLIDALSVSVRAASTPDEVGDIVRECSSSVRAVYPLGGRTRLSLGLPPTKPGVGLDLRGLARVIDYPARDMTVTVEAGITLGALQALLAAERQWLPIDVARPEVATLGGSIAANVSGSRRLGNGTFRDYVIGITTVNDAGVATSAGGRVVKNVAGYDLCKLHTGALGTLGVITQVTLKVRPLPEARALLTVGVDSSRLVAALDRLHESRTRPVCIDVLDRRVAIRVEKSATGVHLPDRAWVLVVGFEDNEAAVEWQMQQLIRELTAAGMTGVEVLAGSATDALQAALTAFTLPDSPALSFKANVLPGRVAEFCLAAQSSPGDIHVQAHAGSGVVLGHSWSLTQAETALALAKLAGLAEASAGRVVITHCAAEWKSTLPAWGKSRADLGLMRAVKAKIDPNNLFNPGRFVEGI